MTGFEVESWWAGGERLKLKLPHVTHSVAAFCRVDGEEGPWVTLIHGFPASSLDWAWIVPHLSEHFRVLSFDLLGFGASDKPSLTYSTALQADLVNEVLLQHGVRSTHLVSHDIGTAVAQELLDRMQNSDIMIESAAFLNGMVFIDHYRPAFLQRFISSRLGGVIASKTFNRRVFSKLFRSAFGQNTQPSQQTCDEYWRAMCEQDGNRIIHRLAYYVQERLREGRRWQQALCDTPIPLVFIWGMADPFAGEFVVQDIEKALPGVPIHRFEGIGHFPHLEMPEKTASTLLSWLVSGC